MLSCLNIIRIVAALETAASPSACAGHSPNVAADHTAVSASSPIELSLAAFGENAGIQDYRCDTLQLPKTGKQIACVGERLLFRANPGDAREIYDLIPGFMIQSGLSDSEFGLEPDLFTLKIRENRIRAGLPLPVARPDFIPVMRFYEELPLGPLGSNGRHLRGHIEDSSASISGQAAIDLQDACSRHGFFIDGVHLIGEGSHLAAVFYLRYGSPSQTAWLLLEAHADSSGAGASPGGDSHWNTLIDSGQLLKLIGPVMSDNAVSGNSP